MPAGDPGGVVGVEKPKTRIDQAWRALWWAMLATVPNNVHKTRRSVNATRAMIARKRR